MSICNINTIISIVDIPLCTSVTSLSTYTLDGHTVSGIAPSPNKTKNSRLSRSVVHAAYDIKMSASIYIYTN